MAAERLGSSSIVKLSTKKSQFETRPSILRFTFIITFAGFLTLGLCGSTASTLPSVSNILFRLQTRCKSIIDKSYIDNLARFSKSRRAEVESWVLSDLQERVGSLDNETAKCEEKKSSMTRSSLDRFILWGIRKCTSMMVTLNWLKGETDKSYEEITVNEDFKQKPPMAFLQKSPSRLPAMFETEAEVSELKKEGIYLWPKDWDTSDNRLMAELVVNASLAKENVDTLKGLLVEAESVLGLLGKYYGEMNIHLAKIIDDGNSSSLLPQNNANGFQSDTQVNAENDHEFPDAAKVDKLNKEIANLYDDNEILLGRLYPLLVTFPERVRSNAVTRKVISILNLDFEKCDVRRRIDNVEERLEKLLKQS